MKGIVINPHARLMRDKPKSYRTRNGRILLKSGRAVTPHGLLCLALMGARPRDIIQEDAR